MGNMQIHFGEGDNVFGNKYVYIGTSAEESEEVSYEDFLVNLKNEFLNLPMMGISKILNIEKIFIPLSISPENLSGEKMTFDTKGFTVDADITELYTNRDRGTPYRLAMNDHIPLHSILTYQKAVVLGEPGSGKTTLFKHLLLDICNGYVCSGCIPIFVKLVDIPSFELGCISMFLQKKYKLYICIIEHALKSGNVVFFLDGFDEIHKDKQVIIANEISRIAAYKNRIYISCRSSVFPRSVLSSDFIIFECMGFDLVQRKRFIRNWFPNEPEFSIRICKEKFENISTFGLSRNPLLLSLIMLQFEENPQFNLPQKRIDIYLGAVNVLLKKQEISCSIDICEEQKWDLLEWIAFSMSDKEVEVFSYRELSKVIGQWKKKYLDLGEKISITQRILIEWICKSGVLFTVTSEYGEGQYRFLHLTFQEALTARYIVNQKDPVQYVNKNIGIPYKEETVRLIMSMLDVKQISSVCNNLNIVVKNLTKKNQFYIVVGRYLSDMAKLDNVFITDTFDWLISCFLKPSYDILYQDLIVSLSSLCNAQQSFMRYFIEQNRKNIADIRVLTSYIDVLKLSPSKISSNELKRILIFFSKQNSLKKDLQTEILGMIIDALRFTYDDYLWSQLYYKYVNNKNYEKESHLAAVTAEALGQVGIDSIKEIVLKKLGKKSLNVLDISILYKYEDNEINHKLYRYAFEPDIECDMCCYLASVNNIGVDYYEDVKSLIKVWKKSSIKTAYLLSSRILFSGKFLSTVEEIILDAHSPMVVRIAALDNYLRSNKNNPEKLLWALMFVQKSSQSDFFLTLINAFSYIVLPYFYSSFFRMLGECYMPSKVIVVILRFLSANTIECKGVVEWLSEQLEECTEDTEMYLLTLLALAKHHDPFIYKKLDSYYNYNRSHCQIIVVCKALTYLNTERAAQKLLQILNEQKDISVIATIINMLGELSFSNVHNLLLQYLDSSNWPKNWPEPQPVLKRGEQRPEDSRKLNIIMALNKSGVKECLPALKKIVNDDSETNDVRKAADIVIRNLAWDSRIY